MKSVYVSLYCSFASRPTHLTRLVMAIRLFVVVFNFQCNLRNSVARFFMCIQAISSNFVRCLFSYSFRCFFHSLFKNGLFSLLRLFRFFNSAAKCGVHNILHCVTFIIIAKFILNIYSMHRASAIWIICISHKTFICIEEM